MPDVNPISGRSFEFSGPFLGVASVTSVARAPLKSDGRAADVPCVCVNVRTLYERRGRCFGVRPSVRPGHC